MHLKSIDLLGFKSFGKRTVVSFGSEISAVVGPNGAGKSNIADSFRFVLGEQSMKAIRGKKGEDMIWNGSQAVPRQNRASVKLVFNNTDKLLDIDFSEVTLERVVHRDGINQYLLNDTEVRLKDIMRLLAGANIGGSGYQIISQGEADRVLNASPKERREMLEDALGLKLYQHKKAESEKKLEETLRNVETTKSLRRELAPHLMFLRREVEKIERSKELREEFAASIQDHLERENARIQHDSTHITEEQRAKELEKGGLLQRHRALAVHENPDYSLEKSRIRETEDSLYKVRDGRSTISRELGRAEGALARNTVRVEAIVPVPHVREFLRTLEALIRDGLMEPLKTIEHIKTRIVDFIETLNESSPETNHEAEREVERLTEEISKLEQEEMRLRGELRAAEDALEAAQRLYAQSQRERLELDGFISNLDRDIASLNHERTALTERKARYEEEVREAIALLGEKMPRLKTDIVPEGALSEDSMSREKRRRSLERLKVRLEEAGLGESDRITREYTDTKQRDEFLAKEIGDLESSVVNLRGIIVDLSKTIDARFLEGLVSINTAFQHFFSTLFSGGDAKISIEKPEASEDETTIEESPSGLEISLNLPRKKVRGIEALSGGERALTSIALIFAMTQVNPPPFLILDETDAALDEANSRRYADMIRELGKKSQLIVITHNRATMSAAGELFGVTMAGDGVSRLLAVKLEEAERVAK